MRDQGSQRHTGRFADENPLLITVGSSSQVLHKSLVDPGMRWNRIDQTTALTATDHLWMYRGQHATIDLDPHQRVRHFSQ
jgi:hypothetical protein